MIVLIIIGIVVITSILLVYFMAWIVHYTMCTDACSQYEYATFKQFMNTFNECEGSFKYDKSFPNSIFIEKQNNKYKDECFIHASIIKFDNKGMIIKPYEYWKFLLWKHQYLKDYKPNKIDWSK